MQGRNGESPVVQFRFELSVLRDECMPWAGSEASQTRFMSEYERQVSSSKDR